MPSYLITGASRGLGYAFLKHLSSANPSNIIFALVRNPTATTSRLASDGITNPNIHILSADVTDISAVRAAAASAAKILGEGHGLDVLIHNAALMAPSSRLSTILEHGSAEKLGEDLLESFKANTISTAYVVDSFLPLIRKGQLKKAVLISTGQGDVDAVAQFGMSVGTPYSVSKAGGSMLMAKYHAAIGRQEGIVFMSISPGIVDTSEGDEGIKGELKMFAKIFMDNFPDYAPDFKGAITPEKSAEMVLGVVERADVESLGGGFVSHHGNKIWL